ncbi:MAG: ABC transporter ATP-binding protein [Synergistota bacterium]|nr:ABC transporter ATP-binding protein [Synergistota bacterium]
MSKELSGHSTNPAADQSASSSGNTAAPDRRAPTGEPSAREPGALRKLHSILAPRERAHALAIFLAGLLTAFAQTAGVLSIFPFINVVMDPSVIQTNRWLAAAYSSFGFASRDSFMIALGIAVIAVLVLSNLVTALTMWAKSSFVLNMNHTLSSRLLAVYLARPYDFFLRSNTSELGKNVLAEVNQLTVHFLMPLFDSIINTLVLAVITAMLLAVNAPATLGILAFLATVYTTLNIYLKVKLKRTGVHRLEANRLRFLVASEALSSIKTTRVLGAEPYFMRLYRTHSRRFARLNVFAQVVGQTPYYLMETIVFGGLILFVVLALARGAEISVIIPLVGLYAFAGKRMMPALQQIYAAVMQLYYNQPILDRLHADLADQSRATDDDESPDPDIPFDRRILLQDIRFRYPDGVLDVLDGLTLDIPKNAVIGLVGATGSGKTTLVDIILGLLVPQQGRMLVDEAPITEDNVRAWRRKIGYVPQEIYLSDDTIRRNIAFGVPDERIDDDRVREAARIAALDAFIRTLPEQYDTVIGERGVRLSGGQRQRIGLARALYRDPEVLVLDEATSSLDGATEEAVLNAVRGAAQARTVIMIAHRLNTLKDCDAIYIIEDGRLTDSGRYDELMRRNRIFMRMAKVGEEKSERGVHDAANVYQAD